MKSAVVGGAMLPHAPQFFTRPETEDPGIIRAVEDVAARIGAMLQALDPDLWIIFSNDHADQFFHRVSPPFTVHVGAEAAGHFAGHNFHWQIRGDVGLQLVHELYRQGFDPAFTSTARIDYAIGIPLTQLAVHVPVLPIYVNAYLPPQPTMERCYGFGQAVSRAVSLMGLRTVALASGGMSHFPGTDRYSSPDLNWDKKLLERLAQGRLKSLIGFDAAELDDAGNVELRCWACAAGMIGENKPDIVSMNPSWHHNYVSLGWSKLQPAEHKPHYPVTKPELVPLVEALHGLAHNVEDRQSYLKDRDAYSRRFGLEAAQQAALTAFDLPTIVGLGVHPLLAFLANMELQRARWSAVAAPASDPAR
jgi:2,3-dihydroxyphenylpropionate 1,2-dioxygenase